MGPLIKTQMTRCIHCTRCIRFATEVAGVPEIGAVGRGENMEITTYLEKSMTSELSANVIDLCPVGALTSKPYAFEARPWELKKTESIDVMDAVGSNIRVDTYGWEVKRVLPRLNNEINEEWISDKTRYACDGLQKQRLDVPYVKKDNRLVKSSWEEALNIVSEKIKNFKTDEIGGHVGDLISLENSLAYKNFFNEIDSSNLEFRERKFYINPKDKINYIFNSSIQGIEESDLILLIGSNPRHEATMINARIRKTANQNKIPIYSVGDPGDLTYNYEIVGNNTDFLSDFVNSKNDFSKKFLCSKKPIVIIGESALEIASGKFIFEEIKNFLYQNKFITKNWNALNILTKNASTVGSIDLKLLSYDNNNNFIFFDKLENKNFKLLYLLGSDNLGIKKENEFIIYQGSHGDKGASIADVILPSAAYTEQNGLYSNLEGRVQDCRKASYPPGQAKEDWEIFNLILKKLNKKIKYKDFDYLRDQVLKSVPNFSEISNLPKNIFTESKKLDSKYISEKIHVNKVDYYFTNSICRASKTMADCRSVLPEAIKEEARN
jgi:NADH-quinone oxidoreductase subunit G